MFSLQLAFIVQKNDAEEARDPIAERGVDFNITSAETSFFLYATQKENVRLDTQRGAKGTRHRCPKATRTCMTNIKQREK